MDGLAKFIDRFVLILSLDWLPIDFDSALD